MNKINLNTCIKKTPAIDIDNINSAQGKTTYITTNTNNTNQYRLNSTAQDILSNIKTSTLVKDLIKSLTNEYNVSFNTCKADVLPFLENLYKANLIEIIPIH